MSLRNTYKQQWISGFLLALFLAFYFNITFFSHVHIVEGERVVHSHIYNQHHNNSCGCHNDSSGGHTPNELLLICKNSAFETLKAIPSTTVSNPVTIISDDAKIFISERIEVGFSDYFYLRGPPVA
ncbi:MAG: hypothetical protein FWG79_01760 [Bacteroidales bacterium]|nr:hypothetical protein [Bacteroidales bacterium]